MTLAAASATPARRDAPNYSGALQITIFVVATVLVVAPLVPIVVQAFIDRPIYEGSAHLTVANFGRLLSDPAFWSALKNTLGFAVIMTVLAQIIGTILAILVARTDMPGRAFFGEVIIWPLFLSHLLMAFGWYIMYGPSGYLTLFVKSALGTQPWDLYTVPGMAVVAATTQAPLAYLYCVAAVRNADSTLEASAHSVGAGPWRVLTTITLPLLRPAILYGLVMNFVVAIEMLSIPLIFGKPARLQLYATYLYDAALTKSPADHGLISAAALLMLLFVLGLLACQAWLMRGSRRFVTTGGKATHSKLFPLGRARWPVAALALVFICATNFVVVGAIMLRSVTELLSPLIPLQEVLTWHNYELLLEQPIYLRSIKNTILIAVIGAILGTALTTLITLVSHRSEFRFARALEFLAQFPRALPGVFGGLAFLYLVLAIPAAGWLRNTIWVLVFAYVIRYLPAVVGTIVPPLQQISRDLDNAARNTGASWWTACRTILLPMLKSALFSCLILLFVLFMKEYVTAVFLVAPNSEVIGTTLLQRWSNGDTGPVAALATIQIIVTVILIYAARKLLGVKLYG
uniref:Iron ABC transporter permease n=1 Tax=Bosea sp. NBC_00436 TaxID=2969620 RepID=A0A9E8A412_9HYPH